jgi:hypothetical protein
MMRPAKKSRSVMSLKGFSAMVGLQFKEQAEPMPCLSGGGDTPLAPRDR